MDASYAFSKFIAELRYEDIPENIVELVKLDVMDTLGCMLAGADNESVSKMIRVMRAQSDLTECRVFGRPGVKLAAADAAFVNGSATFVIDYDDLCDPANLHIGAASVPVALAMAEKLGGCTGRELITALTAGMEIACRLGIYMNRRIADEVMGGWDYIFLLGIFSAAAIASKLMGLNEEQIQNALGIAYHQAAGQSMSARDKADTKIMGSGFACRAGILSAVMAAEGLTGAKNIFDEMPGSLANLYNSGVDRVALTAGLGTDFALKYLGFKAYPCCGNTQRHIDAVLSLVREHAIRPEEIVELRLHVAEMVYPMCVPYEQTRAPKSMMAAQFNIPWTSACAAARGRVSLAEFTDEAFSDPVLLATAQKLICIPDKDLANYREPALVEIETTRGTFSTHTSKFQTGHWAKPMTREALEAKFADCCGLCSARPAAETVAAVTKMIAELETLTDGRDLVALLP